MITPFFFHHTNIISKKIVVTVPMAQMSSIVTVPVAQILFVGTVPMYNFFLSFSCLIQSLLFYQWFYFICKHD